MSNSVVRSAPKWASCPTDGSVLAYYSDKFESVYALLHPFIRPITIDQSKFSDDTWPTKLEYIAGCEPVTWRETLALVGMGDYAEIDIALRTSLLSVRREYSRPDLADKLVSLTEKHGLMCPEEGELPPLLENRIYSAIQSLGYESVWLSDEFGEVAKPWSIDALFELEEIPFHGCVYTPDHQVLVTTHWDSHCSFLCASREKILKMLEIESMEGFFCTDRTQVYWGLHGA